MSVSDPKHASKRLSTSVQTRICRLRDLNAVTATELLTRLNPWDVSTRRPDENGILTFQSGGRRVRSHNPKIAIVTNAKPAQLTYPNGWFYKDGRLRSYRSTLKDFLSEVSMFKVGGSSWWSFAKYCTLSVSSPVVEGYKLRVYDAVWLLGVLNPRVSIFNGRLAITVDADPSGLIYPEGWEYRDGKLCNNPPCGRTASVAIPMLDPDRLPWDKGRSV